MRLIRRTSDRAQDDSNTTRRILVADDHPIVLDGLETLFRQEGDIEIVGRCRSGDDTLSSAAWPDLHERSCSNSSSS